MSGNAVCSIILKKNNMFSSDMSQVELILPEDNSKIFLLRWNRVYVPEQYNVISYNIVITDQSGKFLKNDTVKAIPLTEIYQYSYTSQQSRSSLPECSQLVFSVVALTIEGSSQSVLVSWEKLKRNII